MWHQEFCALPVEFVCKVRGFHRAHNEEFVSCRLPAIEPPLSGYLAPSSVQRLKYSGSPWDNAKFSNPCLRSRPITKIIIPLGFILRSWPTRMSSISAWHAVRHFMLSHVTSCRLLGKVGRLGGCYGNCRVQPLVCCDGVPCRLVSKWPKEIHGRDFFLWMEKNVAKLLSFRNINAIQPWINQNPKVKDN